MNLSGTTGRPELEDEKSGLGDRKPTLTRMAAWPASPVKPEGREKAERWRPHLLNEGDGNHVPGDNAVVHEL